MKNFVPNLISLIKRDNRVNYRAREAHYASGNLTCLRDQYWQWTNEPKTNPTDFKGAMKMLVGNAIEDGLVKLVLSKLHFLGLHFIGTQVPVGGSDPDWHGYLDALVARKTDAGWDTFAIEIKTKSGYGADLFYRDPTPDKGYMIQLGLYLKCLHEKGVTDKGCFMYVLLSDRNFGTIVTVDCEYDAQTNSVNAYRFETTDGKFGSLNVKVDLTEAADRWINLDKALLDKKVPNGEYAYKHVLTREYMDTLSDAQLKKVVAGTVVGGDWQVLYSGYKDKQLELDGLSLGRTNEEKEIARLEYKRRHPKSKI